MKFATLIFNTVQERKTLIKLFSAIALGCVSLIVLRLVIHADRTFLFLLWNFFLALIPLGMSSIILQMNRQNSRTSSLMVAGIFWMLFFPNAPYMLTDFIHLSYGHPYYQSLDILTISWFAVSALLAAIISLNDISTVLSSRYRQKRVTVMVLGLSLLAGFGIYLGRYLRFNSWDIVKQPDVMFWQITERVVNPVEHPNTWMITLGFGMLLFLVYLGTKLISKEFSETGTVRVK